MSKLDQYTGFRGGVVYAAANVLPATVHTWAIEIGEARGGGHKRYDAIDAVMLALMRVLTVEAGLPAGRAAALLNWSRDDIASAIRQIVSEWEAQKKREPDGGPYLHIKPASSRVSRAVDQAFVFDETQLLEAIHNRSSGMAQIIVPLPRNVWSTLASLENVISGNKPAVADGVDD